MLPCRRYFAASYLPRHRLSTADADIIASCLSDCLLAPIPFSHIFSLIVFAHTRKQAAADSRRQRQECSRGRRERGSADVKAAHDFSATRARRRAAGAACRDAASSARRSRRTAIMSRRHAAAVAVQCRTSAHRCVKCLSSRRMLRTAHAQT